MKPRASVHGILCFLALLSCLHPMLALGGGAARTGVIRSIKGVGRARARSVTVSSRAAGMETQRDSDYPGTSVERMVKARDRVRSLSYDDLSQDWEEVRCFVTRLKGLSTHCPCGGLATHLSARCNDASHASFSRVLRFPPMQVRKKILWAAGLKNLQDVPPGQGNTEHCFNDHNHWCVIVLQTPNSPRLLLGARFSLLETRI